MTLHHQHFGEGRPLIILHGLFGSSDNWQTLARRFAEHREVFVVDQRNHGRSPHSDAFSYPILAEDLRDFMDRQSIESATVIGHSMGGKTAMYFAGMYPHRMDALIVADMGVKSYPPHHQDVLEAFHAIEPETLESRGEAEDRLKPIIGNRAVRQFLLKNLNRRKDGSYEIRVNYRVLEEKMDEILKPVPEEPVDLPALFVAGKKSDYIPEEDHDAIRKIFPRAEFVELDAGHWLHAEDPDGFYTAVMDFETKRIEGS